MCRCVGSVGLQQLDDADTNLDNMILDGCGGVEDDDEQTSNGSTEPTVGFTQRLKLPATVA